MPGMFEVHNALWFVHLEYLDYESLGMVPVAQVMLGWVFGIPSAPRNSPGSMKCHKNKISIK